MSESRGATGRAINAPSPGIARTFWVRVIAVSAALMLGACAARTPPALPAALAYPDFLYPSVPGVMTATAVQTAAIDRGWRHLQNDQLGAAEREFAAALAAVRGFYPAETGAGDVWLARRDYARALAAFDRALAAAATYVPALVGRGQSLLALHRDADALRAFEAALASDPSLADVGRRVDLLRFRGVQQDIQEARTAAAAGRLEEARDAYRRVLATSPDSGFLYRELGLLERRQGEAAGALEYFRRAATLDPSDGVSLVQMAELLEQRGDWSAAEAAYRKANDLEPSADLAARAAAAAAKAGDARLPADFRAIEGSSQISRADLAALLGVRLESLVRATPGREQVMTDIRGHWAAPWIAPVTRAGFMEVFDNHTFQPGAPVRRVDLARAVSRVVARLASTRPALRARLAQRPVIGDVGPGHLNYPEVSAAVASGVMPLVEGDRFLVTRPVTGVEAIDAVGRLRGLEDVR